MSKEQSKALFYTQGVEEVLKSLDTSIDGLSTAQAKERLDAYGYNELDEGEKRSLLSKFIDQFKDLMIIILLVAAALSIITEGRHGLTDACIIFAVVVLNAAFGVYQEGQAEAAIEALKNMSSPMARVRRDGNVVEIDSRELVPGDIVLLEAGDVVPADMRLIEAASLKIEEAALTGESVPVEKDITETVEAEAGIGDRVNMCYQNSNVTYGRGTGVVTNTGMYTEVGKIADMLANADESQTPLKQSLEQLSKTLTYLIIAIALVTFLVSVFIRGEQPLEGLMVAVALAVAAIPEGLPAIVTILLSLGTTTLAKRNAIVRKLPAVETLGSTEIIASDKTGTLTMNQMTVEKVYTNGQLQNADTELGADNTTLRIMTFANDTKVDPDGKLIGDPTETALINLGSRYGVEAASIRKLYPRNGELPFDSDRKMMSTLHLIDGKNQMIVKGAVDKLLERTEQIWTKEGIRKITEEDKEKIQRQNQKFSMEGLRVLAFTYREIPKNHTLTSQDEDHLVFLGLIAMMDPPREESKAAVAECIKAGIRPVMITGDHKITAAAIAKRVGILHDLSEACEGADIENMSDEELKEFVPNISVYARVSPEHKIRIVRAWQERGMIVAMTGDGVNDAPALKQADIGVAMGMTGTEVAKDAAAMVLTDDNFATIVKAVENGRNLYQNIKYAIQFLLSGNFGAILTVLCSSVAGLPVPFAPVHLLFINLLTDSLPAIALGLEPDRSEVMSEKPRLADESILTKDFLSKIGLEGLVIGAMTMISFLTGYNQNGTLLGSTYAFGTLCLARLFHGYNCKSDHPVIFTKGLFHNKWLQGAFVLGTVLITTVLTVPGFHNLFKVETLNLMQLGCVYLYAFASLPIIQLLKWIRMKLRKRGER